METEKLLTLKKLAVEMGVGYSYTRAMKKAGLPLPGGRAALSDAKRWLRKNPDFRVAKQFEGKS